MIRVSGCSREPVPPARITPLSGTSIGRGCYEVRGAYVLLTGVHYVSCVRYSFPLLMTAAILVPGGAARGERIGAATPLLTFSVHYRANGSVAGDGGICAAGPGGHSFRVTDPYEDDTPSWSPDGNRIAFARFWDRGNPPGRHDEVDPALCLTVRVTDPPPTSKVTCLMAGAPLARTGANSPQRRSWTMPLRAIAWVETVSLGNEA